MRFPATDVELLAAVEAALRKVRQLMSDEATWFSQEDKPERFEVFEATQEGLLACDVLRLRAVEIAESRGAMADLDDFTREEFRRTLQSLMSDISEENWAAVWMMGTEFDLWSLVLNERPFVWTTWSVTEEDRERLRGLSTWLGEWVIWDDDGVRPIPLAEWETLYGARRRADQND